MAKDNRKRTAADEFDDFKPEAGTVPVAELKVSKADTDAAAADAVSKTDADLRAENEKLRAELAALKAASPVSAGGKFTVSIKDGPTATVEVPAGERPEDVFNATLGIHSTPHRHSVLAAGEDAKCGVHYPDGSVRAFGAAV